MRLLHIDLETYSSVNLQKAGLYKYVQSPDFQILLFAYSFDGGAVNVIDCARGEQLPEHITAALGDPNVKKAAHNAAFEIYCLNKFFHSPVCQWHCTMVHSLYCGFPASLDAAGRAMGLPEDKRKMGVGKQLIRYFCVPCTPTARNGGRTRNLPIMIPQSGSFLRITAARTWRQRQRSTGDWRDIPFRNRNGRTGSWTSI